MNSRKILILGFALVAALAALFLVRNTLAQRSGASSARAAAVQGEMVLAALNDIPAGSPARSSSLGWIAFPPEALHPSFITMTADPEALQKFEGSVARTDIVKGEPITATRLVKTGDQGYFAALVKPGHRAVAIKMSAESAVAGFIGPNDRVDVIVTRKGDTGASSRSDVLFSDVRVISVGDDYREAGGGEPKRSDANVATLELAPGEAEALALAQATGEITLALRAISAGEPSRRAASGFGSPDSVVIHAFGAVTGGAGKGGR
jgi:pilus assembly protein CpaB